MLYVTILHYVILCYIEKYCAVSGDIWYAMLRVLLQDSWMIIKRVSIVIMMNIPFLCAGKNEREKQACPPSTWCYQGEYPQG